MPAAPSLDVILEELQSGNEDVREAAALQLGSLSEAGLSESDGLRALEAATRRFPARKLQLDDGEVKLTDTAADLVHAAATRPRASYIDKIRELFSRLGEEAKVEALDLLARLPDREAAIAFMSLLQAHAVDVPRIPISTLQCELRHADVFFPAMLDLADDPVLGLDVCELCLSYCDAGLIAYARLSPYAPRILELYEARVGKLQPPERGSQLATADAREAAPELKWMWEEDYLAARHEASMLLDLLGHFPTPEAKAELRRALASRDPRLKHFAVVALLRHGESVDAARIEEVAASAEMRNWLFDNLAQLMMPEIFPATWRTQEAFAESELVGWLTHPEELGQIPDAIELAKVVTIETESALGPLDYFVFRFRMDEPHWAADRGWMGGVAGPYFRNESPTTKAYGATGSAYEPWEGTTPEQHIGDLAELTAGWRAYARAHS